MSETELLKRIADDVTFLKEKVNKMESLLEETLYPTEDLLRREFIERVEAAEERIGNGKGLKFKGMDEFLESVEQ
ncbi:MAG: hypothetical protein V3R93_06430 [Candidatus Hydrothermarchaeaceae archaeon]